MFKINSLYILNGRFSNKVRNGLKVFFHCLLVVAWLAADLAQAVIESPNQVFLPLLMKGAVSIFEGAWEKEPNNTYTTANTALISDRNYSGRADDANDYYAFYQPVPGPIHIMLTNAASGAQMLLYYESTNNTPVVKNAEPYDLQVNAAAGWYYLRIYTPPQGISDSWVYNFHLRYNHPPLTPRDPYPENEATFTNLSLMLTWTGHDPEGDPVTYDVYFEANDDTPDTLVAADSSNNQYVTGALQQHTTYYWQVISTESHGAVSVGPVWNFTTAGAPGIFSKTSPTNGSSGVALSPMLTWETSPWMTSYEYCYDQTNDDTCSSWTNIGAATQVSLSSLSSQTTYFWQVRAVNTYGSTYADGSSADDWSFTTSGPPGDFSKTSPSNAAISVQPSPTLKWGASSQAGYYEICHDTSNDSTCSGWVNVGTATSYSLTGLTVNTTYYWQVRAVNDYGTVYADGSSGAYNHFKVRDLILIPSGMFNMGCDPAHNGGFSCLLNETPLHPVQLDSYYIDRTEVTVSQYSLCVAAGGCAPPSSNGSATRLSYYDNPAFATYPVIFVSWQDAANYCTWAGMRLPTEAEWEKAARGSSTNIAYPWGDSAASCVRANYGGPSGCVGDTTGTASLASGASPYGVMELSGNVLEWVNDWYDANYYATSTVINPPGPSTGTAKVMRGGSWALIASDIRNAFRLYTPTSNNQNDLGFRCAKTPE